MGSKPHPNIWIFINTIQKEELLTSIKIASLENGNLKTRGRRNNDLLRDLEIVNAKAQYLESEQKDEDLLQLLNKLLNCFYFCLTRRHGIQ